MDFPPGHNSRSEPMTARRRRLAGALSAIVLSAVALLLWQTLPTAERTCRIESRRLGERFFLQRRLPLRTYFGTIRPVVDPASSAIDGALSGYIRSWVTARIAACGDAGATDRARRARLTARLSCLQERAERLQAVLKALSDPEVAIEEKYRLTFALRPAKDCLDESVTKQYANRQPSQRRSTYHAD
jgi:hypothetical protein